MLTPSLTRPCLALTLLAATVGSASAASSCPKVPGFDFAAFGDTSISMSGGAQTDSYDSSAGTYAATRSSSNGDLGTNSTTSGSVKLSGSGTTVNGTIDVGFGGSPGSVINTSGGSSYAGSAVMSAAIPLTPITIPAVGTNQGNQTLTAGAVVTLTPNQTYGTVKVSGGSTLIFRPGTYVLDSLSLSGTSIVSVPVGPVVVYIRSGLDLSGGGVVNASMKSTDLVFFGAPTLATVKVTGGSSAAFAVYAPSADITVSGGADVYGALVGAAIKNTGGSSLHYDKALGSYTGGPFACSLEISRASPVIASITNQAAVVQGTFELPAGTQAVVTTTAEVAAFTFPYIKGHMRARTTASISTTSSGFAAGTVLFDAAATGKIPVVEYGGCATFTGTCRNVVTTTATPAANGTSFHPALVQLNDANASAIGALIAPPSAVPGIGAAQWQTLVRRVLAGVPDGAGGYASKLGGVDRSTVAVIPASSVAGSPTRPTIAYFGGTDGMLHATCASVAGSTPTATNICPSLGTELWAFLPRTQLPLVRHNTTRLDGSVRVVDAFGDFTGTASGVRGFRTILTFQTGYADATLGANPGVYALDVTDPAAPTVVWEYTTPTTPSAFELGTGLTLAAGPALIGGQRTELVVAQTRNGGTGGAGVVATGLDLETGTKVWGFGFAYPSPPRGVSADLPLPTTGVPGGAVAVDVDRSGFISTLVLGDLYGDLWVLDASTGTSKTGTGVPLFQFSSNKHPIGAAPAIYSNGNQQFAVVGSGAYVDPTAASWSAGTQLLIAVNLSSNGPFPLTETSPQLAFEQNLGAGEHVVAQVLVVGTQLFLSTDSQDVNAAGYGTSGNTGHIVTYDLGTSTTTTVVSRGGASSLASSGTELYNSSSDQQQRLVTDATSTVGPTVDTSTVAKLTRRLWLRTD